MEPFDTPEQALQQVWGYPGFRASQQPAVEACVARRDGLLVLHTSGGKSLCYQAPALCLSGTAVVISPLISLMKDQVDALEKKGVPASYINSSLAPEEVLSRENAFLNGEYKLLYVAPERLDSEAFRHLLAQTPISFFAIDEAHCVSTWGHDFRLSYRRIPDHLNTISRARGERIPRFAYTATATPEIADDIIKQLEMVEPFRYIGSFDRDNIAIHVQATESKTGDTLGLLERHAGEPTIVYCATVKAVEELSGQLTARGVSVGAYHGRMSGELKERIQEDFLAGRIEVIVATNAFGMGVDKPDVRNVIHYHMPGNIESYYQEAGRAGRDGLPSNAYMLYSKNDRRLQEFFIDMNYPPLDSIVTVLQALDSYGQGEPFYLSEREIAGVAADHVDTRHMPAILRILQDQGAIALDKDPNTHEYSGIQVLNGDIQALELSYLDERKKAVLANLSAMEMFCQTSLCRRRYVLRHFGEEHDYDGCGYCDNCFRQGLALSDEDVLISPDTVRAALHAVNELGRRHDRATLHQALLGVSTASMRRRGIDQLSCYGALSDWTTSDVECLIDMLIDERVVVSSSRRRARGAGLQPEPAMMAHPPALRAPPALRHRAHNDVQQGINQRSRARVESGQNAMDAGLYNALEGLREQLARQYRRHKSALFSDALIETVVRNKPTSVDGLVQAGLSRERANLFGTDLLQCIDQYHKGVGRRAEAVSAIPDIPI